ncbi:MAG: hypothetical protein R6U11_03135 [Bacteroidales bacterium]
MKIFIIGSSQYKDKMLEYAAKMEFRGHQVCLPVLDDSKFKNTLKILETNRKRMQWADEVHMFYDGKSQGTVFDFGMAFAMGKPLQVIYMNDKSIVDGMKEYALLFKWESGHFESENINDKSILDDINEKINSYKWVTSRYYMDFKDL